MAHELTPKATRAALPVDEVIRRLDASFAHVELDVDRASRDLSDSLRYMAGVGPPQFADEDIQRARRSLGRSVHVVIADDAKADLAYVSFLLEPEYEKIFIDYESAEHENASRELVQRLARILDYDAEVV
jgi:hypothetical protein